MDGSGLNPFSIGLWIVVMVSSFHFNDGPSNLCHAVARFLGLKDAVGSSGC
jgi:hypothetical protein